MVLTSQNKSHYLGLEEKALFVRYLSSNKTQEDSKCARLEAPNFIGDLPAGCMIILKNNLVLKNYLKFECFK